MNAKEPPAEAGGMDRRRRRMLIVLVSVMLVMPAAGLVRRVVLGETEVEHPFSWQMYTVSEDAP